jgi:hypothetical protein
MLHHSTDRGANGPTIADSDGRGDSMVHGEHGEFLPIVVNGANVTFDSP